MISLDSEYDFRIDYREPVDDNNAGDLFDISVAIPDYVPNGTINSSFFDVYLSFDNTSWLDSSNPLQQDPLIMKEELDLI